MGRGGGREGYIRLNGQATLHGPGDVKRPEWDERVSHEDSWGKIFPGRRQSKCKDLEVKAPLGSLRSSKRASMAAVE